MRSPHRAVIPVLLATLAVLLAGCSGGSGGHQAGATATPTVNVHLAGSGTGSFSDIPHIVQTVEPSVVTVFSQLPQGQATGSGVVWSPDGVIVTDAHVVNGARQVVVQFADGKQSPARVVGKDEFTDLAVLKVARTGLPAAKFADSLPEVGALAVVVGSPLGLEETVTAGIISALERQIPPTQETPHGLFHLIQTDAPISPGNSGGGVFNGQSQVIGISEAYLPPSSGAVAIGFATPSTVVKAVVPQILNNGTVKNAYLGIKPVDVTPEIQQALGLSQRTGVIVAAVENGSPAARAGLQRGDVIVKLGSATIKDTTDLLAALRQHEPGERVPVTIVRDGKKQTVQVTLASYPQQPGG